MKVEYINAFVRATGHVLKTMAFTETKPGKPYIKTNNTALGDVSGVIGMTGESEGSFSITFTEPCICAVVSSMFGESFESLSAEIEDAVGEITNMICGDARRELEENGFLVKGAIPTVVTGKNHTIKHISTDSVISVPFTAESGNFVIEISFGS